MEKSVGDVQATDDKFNTAHAHFMLDTLVYRHKFRICYSYFSATAIMGTLTFLFVAFIRTLSVL